LAGWQSSPGEHDTHAPPLHTMFVPVPHGVPFATLPDSRQTASPVLHTMAPARQGLPFTTQSMPAMQAVHAPPAPHTMLAPQLVPAGRFVPLSVQPDVAPLHTRLPSWQAFAGVHAPPATQATHAPSWQTNPVPHEVPFGWLSDSVQTGAPVAQAMAPLRQGLPVIGQPAPSEHATQVPSRQTEPFPQALPLRCNSPVSMQVMTPLGLQTVSPT